MAGSSHTGPLSILTSSGSLVTYVDADGNLVGAGGTNPFCAAGTSTGTAVNLLPSGGATAALTIEAAFIISVNGSANAVIKNNGSTVATIAIGSAGALVGATSLSNTSVTAGNQVTVEIDSAGEAVGIVCFSYT